MDARENSSSAAAAAGAGSAGSAGANGGRSAVAVKSTNKGRYRSAEEEAALMTRIRSLMARFGYNQTDVKQRSGVSNSTLSLYLQRKYKGDIHSISDRLEQWCDHEESLVRESGVVKKSPVLYPNKPKARPTKASHDASYPHSSQRAEHDSSSSSSSGGASRSNSTAHSGSSSGRRQSTSKYKRRSVSPPAASAARTPAAANSSAAAPAVRPPPPVPTDDGLVLGPIIPPPPLVEPLLAAARDGGDAAAANDALVPLTIDVSVPAVAAAAAGSGGSAMHRYQDIVLWNRNDTSAATIEWFARSLCRDMGMPPARFVEPITQAMQQQLAQLNRVRDAAAAVIADVATAKRMRIDSAMRGGGGSGSGGGDESDSRGSKRVRTESGVATAFVSDSKQPIAAVVDDTDLLKIKLNLTIDNYTLTDTILWSPANPFNSPEQFAQSMSADLGLGAEWSVLIAHTIRQHIERDRMRIAAAAVTATSSSMAAASPFVVERVPMPTRVNQLFRSVDCDSDIAALSEWGPRIERLDGVRTPPPAPFVPAHALQASITGATPAAAAAAPSNTASGGAADAAAPTYAAATAASRNAGAGSSGVSGPPVVPIDAVDDSGHRLTKRERDRLQLRLTKQWEKAQKAAAKHNKPNSARGPAAAAVGSTKRRGAAAAAASSDDDRSSDDYSSSDSDSGGDRRRKKASASMPCDKCGKMFGSTMAVSTHKRFSACGLNYKPGITSKPKPGVAPGQ